MPSHEGDLTVIFCAGLRVRTWHVEVYRAGRWRLAAVVHSARAVNAVVRLLRG